MGPAGSRTTSGPGDRIVVKQLAKRRREYGIRKIPTSTVPLTTTRRYGIAPRSKISDVAVVTGTVRGERGRHDVLDSGGTPVPLDLKTAAARDVTDHLGEVDAVVFAAGAGYGSTTKQKEIIDRDGAIPLADAAELAGGRRYVLISSMGTDSFDARSADPFQIYLRLKSEADAAVRGRELDSTIIRPSG
jgi:uncharacterized protein YbjT (DUF2867 family)